MPKIDTITTPKCPIIYAWLKDADTKFNVDGDMTMWVELLRLMHIYVRLCLQNNYTKVLAWMQLITRQRPFRQLLIS